MRNSVIWVVVWLSLLAACATGTPLAEKDLAHIVKASSICVPALGCVVGKE